MLNLACCASWGASVEVVAMLLFRRLGRKEIVTRILFMLITPVQCRMARAALQIGIRELAALAKVSPNTISRLERGEVLFESTLRQIQAALESAGVEFISKNGGGPGVRLKA